MQLYVDSLKQIASPQIRPHDFGNHIGSIKSPEKFAIDINDMGEKRKQWIYADSIDKYGSTEDIIKLAKLHESNSVKLVAFCILLKRDADMAINILVDDINNPNIVLCGNGDEWLEESISSIRTRIAQTGKEKYKISDKDSIKIDSAVLQSKNRIKNLYYVFNLKKRQHFIRPE